MLPGAVLAFLNIFAWIRSTDGLECYSCSNVTVLKDCNQISSCSNGTACYMNLRRHGSLKLFTLGCAYDLKCPTTLGTSISHPITGGPASIVGRSVTFSDNCHECCTTNNCNRQMCQQEGTNCVDTTDCVTMGAIVNFCSDIKHAKQSCRSFCGLCSMIDGSWSSWAAWSSCDITCGNGSHIRTRTCSKPKPADGGDDCVGQSLERGTCHGPICPVHGGWSQWSSWGSCSHYCDLGLQRRDRSCSQPAPAHNGDPCPGDSREDRLCMPGACADGGWSVWGSWSTCSTSCGYGTRARSRACDNPAPSLVGRACIGGPSQTELCFPGACNDGGWSVWGSWSTCSTSCGYGTRARSRACDNPAPSLVGRACIGDPSQTELCFHGACHDGQWSTWQPWTACISSCGQGMRFRARLCNNPTPSVMGKHCVGAPYEAQSCKKANCPAKLSAFTATNPIVSPRQVTRFNVTKINEGNNYNPTTGAFYCEHPGLYFFNMDLTKKKDVNLKVGALSARLHKNGQVFATIFSDPTDDDTDIGSYAATGSAVIHLAKGDAVSIYSWYALESWSSFSGFLFQPDP